MQLFARLERCKYSGSRLHTILVVHKAEIKKLFCQNYVLLSPCKIDIASWRFCPQLMVGSRSLSQVQRKATKGKPALPTPVRHTEGAKCCFERFIIETITYDIVSGASLPLKRILEDKNLSETHLIFLLQFFVFELWLFFLLFLPFLCSRISLFIWFLPENELID